mgnify:CR=1 FL=1
MAPEATRTRPPCFCASSIRSGQEGTPPALTDEDRQILIVTSDSVKVRSGFLDRVANYCQTVEQLVAVFRHITPISFPAHEKFAVNDSPETKLHRLVDACREMIGSQGSDD